MLTPFGKFTRKLRIDRGELLKNMADNLGVTSSYLSAIENGKRNIPEKWTSVIPRIYNLSDQESTQLKDAIQQSKIVNKVDLSDMNDDSKDIMVALARKIDGLDSEKRNILKNMLD